ncbi:MAG: hypothetical protein EXR71_02145 [Myxococcales bacterium]|nr:hypothetical protein [Myxococcales bacterium]
MVLFVLSTAALAAPSRCVATLALPVPACSLGGPITVTDAAPAEPAAKRAARNALGHAVQAAVAAIKTESPLFAADLLAGCGEAVAAATVECFPDARLADEQYCFVSLAEASCWGGEVLTLEDRGWKVFAAGRSMMCKAVDDRLVARNFADVAIVRARCAAVCASQVQVRCP